MMKNLPLTAALISVLALSLYTTGTLFAAALKCSVVEVDEQKIILDCGDAAKKLKSGTEVKVKTVKQTAAVEGC